jgi:hypothetical protein
MKNDLLRSTLAILVISIALTSCGGNAPTPPLSASAPTSPAEALATTISTTSDPCVSPQIEAEVQKVQKYMREFDDASLLASSVPQAQLSTSIADLQRIRREADDQPIPECLTALKALQIQHMNAAINTFLAVLRLKSAEPIDCSNAANSPEQQALCQNFALASQYHDQYLLELARVLGITVVPATPGLAIPAVTTTP